MVFIQVPPRHEELSYRQVVSLQQKRANVMRFAVALKTAEDEDKATGQATQETFITGKFMP